MTWEYESINSLTKTVYLRYNTCYWGDAERWASYLCSVGIRRSPGRLRPTMRLSEPHLFIECPYSVHNSVVGSGLKHYLLIPEDVAEKILLLGAMPSEPSLP